MDDEKFFWLAELKVWTFIINMIFRANFTYSNLCMCPIDCIKGIQRHWSINEMKFISRWTHISFQHWVYRYAIQSVAKGGNLCVLFNYIKNILFIDKVMQSIAFFLYVNLKTYIVKCIEGKISPNQWNLSRIT